MQSDLCMKDNENYVWKSVNKLLLKSERDSSKKVLYFALFGNNHLLTHHVIYAMTMQPHKYAVPKNRYGKKTGV
jgi:hypothetical protein